MTLFDLYLVCVNFRYDTRIHLIDYNSDKVIHRLTRDDFPIDTTEWYEYATSIRINNFFINGDEILAYIKED